MVSKTSALSAWSEAEVARGRQWVETWRRAGAALDAIKRDELRRLDAYAAIASLCGPVDYHAEPYAPKPTSGLVEQQRLFRKLSAR